jgi:hypothetical protein
MIIILFSFSIDGLQCKQFLVASTFMFFIQKFSKTHHHIGCRHCCYCCFYIINNITDENNNRLDAKSADGLGVAAWDNQGYFFTGLLLLPVLLVPMANCSTRMVSKLSSSSSFLAIQDTRHSQIICRIEALLLNNPRDWVH